MKGDIERFLAWLAVFSGCLVGCTVETSTSGIGSTTSSTPTGSGPTTTGSSTTGATSTSATGAGGAGGAGTDASSGTGGAPVDGGGDVSSPADAGACFADLGADASVPSCASLPYASVNCADDAMREPPLGSFICEDLEGDLEPSALRELVDCLKTVPADGGTEACSTAHDTAASACSVTLFSRTTCAVPGIPVDGGTLGCAQIVASCPGDGGAGGISMANCQRFLAPFNALARQFIIECYFDPMGPQGTSCADKFENECVFPDL